MGILKFNGKTISQVAVKNNVTVNGVMGEDLGVASPSDVLNGVTFTSKDGICIEGAMTNNGAWVTTPNENGNILIPKGYHNGNGYVDTTNVYNAGVTAGVSTLGSGQGKLIYYTSNLLSPSSSGSSDKGVIYSWTNTYGAGKVYVYADVTNGSSSYCYTTISINGSQAFSGSSGEPFLIGKTISNNGSVTVSCQARAGVKEFLVIFIKD